MPKYTSIQETAYNYVRNKVLTGQLQPNVLYSETKMAAEIHISRTPMKDALVRLSQDRFIDIIPSKGFCLHKMSEEDIWHTYQARTAVEGFCAMQLAQHRDEADGQAAIRALEGCLTDVSRLLAEMSQKKVSLEELLERDLQFHQALVDYVQNTELAQLFNTYHYRLYFFALESLRLDGRPEKAYQEHRKILDAILDPEDTLGIHAYLAIVQHMESTRNIMLSILAAE